MPGRNTTHWTRDRGQLFFGQPADFHSRDFAIKAAAKLSNLAHWSTFVGTLSTLSAALPLLAHLCLRFSERLVRAVSQISEG
jgi:hypothetical protein